MVWGLSEKVDVRVLTFPQDGAHLALVRICRRRGRVMPVQVGVSWLRLRRRRLLLGRLNLTGERVDVVLEGLPGIPGPLS